MLRGLAADQRAAGAHAALRNALHDLGDLLGVVLAAGDIIEEEERLRAAAHDVVDTHGDAVDADRIVLVEQHGGDELCADAVRAGNEHRLLHAGKLRLEQAAEAADAGNHAGNRRALHVLLHQLHRFIAGGHVDARGLVAVAKAFHFLYLSVSEINGGVT